jgi:hypothetical protein
VPKPAEPKPLEAKTPETKAPEVKPATTDAAPAAPGLLRELFQPSRTKGVIAAGIVSLLGGAATMKYLWPPKTPATAAKTEAEPASPLPAVPTTLFDPNASKELPKVEPVSLTPIVPATGTTLVPELPKIELPAIAPAFAPMPGALPAIALPDLVRTSGTETPKPAEKPLDIKLPELVPSAGVVPSVPTAVAVPLPAATSIPPAPALLALPDVKVEPPAGTNLDLPKVELPKEIKIEPPALTATPVPKLPEIGLPNLSETAVPKIAPALPPVELKPELKPTFVPEVSTVPVTATPTSVRPQPTPIAATPPRTDYDVDLHYVRAGDSWAAISKQHFGDERYADALKGFNQNASLAGAARVEVPPIHVLRKNFATSIGRPVEKSGEWGSISPTSASEPKRSVTGTGYKIYSVPPGGRTLKEIAADAYGDEGRWGMVWDTNPKLVPDKVVPEGTKIYLTSQAKIGE